MSAIKKPGVLYIVPTPIGNYQDISLRVIETLKGVDLIASEDTRETVKLLRHLEIKKKQLSYHDHNERPRSLSLIKKLKEGLHIALLSDAGTPLLADPGYHLVNAAIDGGIKIVSLPGPSAITTGLAASGLETDRFSFIGFLPRKKGKRKTAIEELKLIPTTLVFFEAPHRLIETLTDLQQVLGDRRAVLAWNLTKEKENYFRGTLSELESEISSWEYSHGECTLLVARPDEPDESEKWIKAEETIRLMLTLRVRPRAIRDVVAKLFKLPKTKIYERVLALAEDVEMEQRR